jgi:sterol 3beta-glucosyltransferase
MRLFVSAWGSRGDVEPLLALAVALRARGHDVLFGALAFFEELVRGAGLAFTPIGTPLPLEAFRALIQRAVSEANPRKQNRALLRELLLPDLPRLYSDSVHAVQSADLVIAHWLQLGATLAAEKLAVPWVSVTLHPGGIEVAAETATDREREAANALSEWLWGDAVHQLRAELCLPHVQSIAATLYSPRLNLVAVSRHLLPEAARWPKQHLPVGFFYRHPTSDFVPPQKLEQFLARYPRPIVVSFGSVTQDGAPQRRRNILEAIQRVGRPAILQSTFHDFDAADYPSDVIAVGEVPHDWLFSRAACVVHHGGAGTTAAALRAGVPAVAVWYVFDQPYWGSLLFSHRLGPKPLAHSKLDATSLAERIEAALSSSIYRERLQSLARHISEEDGIRRAVTLVEGVVEQRRR